MFGLRRALVPKPADQSLPRWRSAQTFTTLHAYSMYNLDYKDTYFHPPLDAILRLDSDSDLRNGWYYTGLSISLRNTLLYGLG